MSHIPHYDGHVAQSPVPSPDGLRYSSNRTNSGLGFRGQTSFSPAAWPTVPVYPYGSQRHFSPPLAANSPFIFPQNVNQPTRIRYDNLPKEPNSNHQRPEVNYLRMPSSSSSLGPTPPIEQHPSPGLPPASSRPTNKNDSEELRDHCEAIFQHPLFPILRLLLEKLEEATLTAIIPTPEAIISEVETVSRRIQQTHSTISTINPEIDDLMVQGVTVLRLHLFELEKVNDLCRDFCDRYTSCLRRNLHADQILRSDDFSCDVDQPHAFKSAASTVSAPNRSATPASHGGRSSATSSSESAHSLPNRAPHSTSVYRMISAPPNYVAQPPQSMPFPRNLSNGSPAALQMTDRQSVSGLLSPISSGSAYDDSERFNEDSQSPKGDRASKRGVLPKDAINLMKSWLFQHIVHPYPTEEEKRVLANQTKLSMLQVNNWFINARRRILQPMLDSTNPSGHRSKKGIQPRPVDPFWTASASYRTPNDDPPNDDFNGDENGSENSSEDEQETKKS